MTDRLDCPDCGGTGEQLIGPVRVVCQFCHGLGYVGDDNEPAERGVSEGDEDEPLPPWWEEPGMDAVSVDCKVCFGAGRVVGLDGNLRGGAASRMVEGPCPVCTEAQSQM